uniref:Translocator protein n=1 Tax=Timema genevievae TaxID=629358 RepID=A0A7R9K351_TIMGE|nr:unnamed protein product [Timema genevievae]
MGVRADNAATFDSAMTTVWTVVGAIVLPNLGGWFGAYYNAANVKTWYPTLKLPSWRPPNYLFGPVWTVLYSSMGYASYLVWRDGGGFHGGAHFPLTLYASQLVLNWAWSPLFFVAHSLKWSLAEIGVLWVNVAACVYTFHQVNPIAGYILLPYLAWLSVASALNYVIWRDNPEKKEK